MFFLFVLLLGAWFACDAHSIEGWYKFSVMLNTYLAYSWFKGWKLLGVAFKLRKTVETALAHIPDKRLREQIAKSEFPNGSVLGSKI